jgi:uncharacterized protein YdcH (DUF465 family)
MDLSLAGDIIKGFFTGILKDMKLIPHTALSAVFLWGIAWLAWFTVYPQIVLSANIVPQVQQLQSSMEKLNATLIVDRMDRDIRAIETEIYGLQREIETLRAKKLEVPDSMSARLYSLQQDKVRAEQKLSNYTRDHSKQLERPL